jgi:hypothetical protein
MTEQKAYKVNPEKLKGAPQSILPYLYGALWKDQIIYYSEDYEYFNAIHPYLDIPEELKTKNRS